MKERSFLSMVTGGIFDGFLSSEGEKERHVPPVVETEERGRKRSRDDEVISAPPAGSRTPTLLTASRQSRLDDAASLQSEDERAPKRLRGECMVVPVPLSIAPSSQQRSDFVRMVPEEVVGNVLSYLGSTEDRFAIQCTSVQFRRISNTDAMLVNLKLGGEMDTGKNGIVQDHDTPETAAEALTPFARAGNLEAIYMLGMIKSYCNQDVERGIFLLKLASGRGCVRSSYALGLLLRDTLPKEATEHMGRAASQGYLPALQETLPAREMKIKYGEPDAAALRRHLDPPCLNRLLGRHYIQCSQLRGVNTSHCWNPLCGRWGYKATAVNGNNVTFRLRHPAGDAAAVQHRHAQAQPVAPQPPPHQPGIASNGNRPPLPRVGHRREMRHENLHGPAQNPATNNPNASVPGGPKDVRISRMKMCSRCCRAKYCSKLCQVYDWRSGRHKIECQFLN